ncbi:hypothetical protein AUJ14_05500 [Candidatus Micrarchaeota archaeon CG1_02_55_22]|nr:MAG: hypothetical protein AUJ14_05500 [Candidatus Micrarchaeota archaeon CG1_02_55_22]
MELKHLLASVVTFVLFLEAGVFYAILLVLCGLVFALSTAFLARFLFTSDVKLAFLAAVESFIVAAFFASAVLVVLSLLPFELVLGVSMPLTGIAVFALGAIWSNSYLNKLGKLAKNAGWRVHAAFVISLIVLCLVFIGAVNPLYQLITFGRVF